MPYVQNGAVRIHYETIGEGRPLVLHHGFARSLAVWRELGYVERLAIGRRVILLDARGHGKSDKPHTPEAYSLELRALDVTAVLDDLGIARADYFGYSMGGRIGFAVAHYAPERLASVIIGAATPDDACFDAFEGIDGNDPDAFVAALEAFIGEILTPERRQAALNNDIRALTALMQAPRAHLGTPPALVGIPTMLYVGTKDTRLAAVRACAALLSPKEYVELHDLNHGQAFLRSDLTLPPVQQFLASAAPTIQPDRRFAIPS